MRPISLVLLLWLVLNWATAIPCLAAADAPVDHDLPTVLASGRLRHLGIPYANFVSGDGGLDVELVRRFADRLGVAYEFVESDWDHIIGDLLGRTVIRDGARVSLGEAIPVRGDLIATGMTVLPWREQLVQFSRPVFPTQIWLIAPAAATLKPIEPSGDAMVDIRTTCRLLSGLSVLAKSNTCLDPVLYDLAGQGAEVVLFHDSLKFMAPAVLDGRAEATILDVPDALVALRRYPGRIKVLGPISAPQHMAAAFPPQSTALCIAYDRFLAELRADGTYDMLVDHYYPAVRRYYPAFFAAEVATP